MNKFSIACLGLVMAATATPAMAQEEEAPAGPVDVSATIGVVSDYRFRGLSLSNGKVAVQGSVNVAHESGLYGGVWASTLPDSALYGTVEVDLYAGYATELASGTGLDVGITYFYYPDGNNGGPADYFEPAVKLSHTLGPVKAVATVAYAWEQDSLGDDDNLYLNLGLSGGVPNTPLTLVGSIGYSDGGLAALAPGGNYIDWSLGADVAAGPATFGVRYIDTDIPKTGIKAIDKLYSETIMASLTFAF